MMRSGGDRSRRNAGGGAAELEALQSPPGLPPRAASPIMVRVRQEGAEAPTLARTRPDDTEDIREAGSAFAPLPRAPNMADSELSSGRVATMEFFKEKSLEYILQLLPAKPNPEACNPSIAGEVKKAIDARKPKPVTATALKAHFAKSNVRLSGSSWNAATKDCFMKFADDIIGPTGFKSSELTMLSLDCSLSISGVQPFQGSATTISKAKTPSSDH
jgi:hypothetical protein